MCTIHHSRVYLTVYGKLNVPHSTSGGPMFIGTNLPSIQLRFKMSWDTKVSDIFFCENPFYNDQVGVYLGLSTFNLFCINR